MDLQKISPFSAILLAVMILSAFPRIYSTLSETQPTYYTTQQNQNETQTTDQIAGIASEVDFVNPTHVHNSSSMWISPRIPQEWINTTQTTQVDLSQFNEMDPDNSIEVTPSTITWNHMDKRSERRVYTELSQTQQRELVSEFSFKIDEFTNNDEVNSRIVSLWMLGETVDLGDIGNRSFTQLYAEHVSNSTSMYKLVLHQRVAGPNQFISVGPVLNVSQRYYVRLIVYNSSIMYHVSDSAWFDEIFFESREYVMVPREYRYLMLSCMFLNPKDRGIWNSGSISDVKIS